MAEKARQTLDPWYTSAWVWIWIIAAVVAVVLARYAP